MGRGSDDAPLARPRGLSLDPVTRAFALRRRSLVGFIDVLKESRYQLGQHPVLQLQAEHAPPSPGERHGPGSGDGPEPGPGTGILQAGVLTLSPC